MAEPRKSRREVLYDHDRRNSRERERGGVDKKMPEAAPAPEKREEESRKAGRAEMLRRHENERRGLYGRHREEHKHIDASADEDLERRKTEAHRRHEAEFADMHARHEQEIGDLMDEGAAPSPQRGG